MEDPNKTKMAAECRADSVTGKTFTTNSASCNYSNAQIMPYSQPYADPPRNNPKQAKAKSSSSWSLTDPEVKRKKRVASYKVYTVEGRVKSSFRQSVRWLKTKYIEMRYGWR